MRTSEQSDVLVSVVIVNYRVPVLVRQALLSLSVADLYGRCEVIVVDNASGDNSEELVRGEFPNVQWIGLKSNIGFGKACNVGAQRAHGAYLLLLNPDTLVSKNTLSVCVNFMAGHPRTGVLGPKILNPDGTLQVSCRRSFPTPVVAFYRLAGLSRLYPKSPRFARYNLTFMDPDQSAQVDAVSGSFMFMPLALFLAVGGFDEQFFMYGEDLDLCRRVRDKGYEVWYHPGTQIIHFKAQSSTKKPLRAKYAFYEAMILFSRKYRHSREAFLPGWLIYISIVIQAAVHIGARLFKSLTACFIDLVIINFSVWAGISIRFSMSEMPVPYRGATAWLMAGMHVLITACFITTFWYQGVYSKTRYSVKNTVMAGLFASVLFMACVYFIRAMAFSRIAFAVTSLFLALLLAGWRELLPPVLGGIRRLVFATGRVIVLGNGGIAEHLIRNVEADKTAEIVGILWPSGEKTPGAFLGYPVLGTLMEVKQALERHRVDVLLIATTVPWYSHIIEALASPSVRKLTIRWVPHELLSRETASLPEVIPLQDFRV